MKKIIQLIHRGISYCLVFFLSPGLTLAIVSDAWPKIIADVSYAQIHIPKHTILDHRHFDINAIDCIMTNNGIIVDHDVTDQAGMEWPKGTGKTIDFNSGLWLAGIGHDDGFIYTACSFYNSDLEPGLWGESSQDSRFRIYMINKDGTGDWNTWPVDQGAPVDDNDEPLLLGDQTLFWVTNDAGEHDVFESLPMNVEIRYIVFGIDHDGPMQNSMFIRWEIINRGAQQFDSCFVALWDDPDVGDATDDLVGCDTTLSLGYCYNGDPDDFVYGSNPPALGFDFLQGPENPRGSGHYMPMTAFVYYWCGCPDPFDSPETPSEAYWFMNGFAGDGTPYSDHLGHETRFCLCGDPVTGTGHLDGVSISPGDRYFLMSSGPFTLAQEDTQTIVGAKIIAQGTDNLSSVAALRDADIFIQDNYDSLTQGERSEAYLRYYQLSQNYPNPFNPVTTIRYELSQASQVQLAIYNVTGQRVALLVNERQKAGLHQVRWDGGDYASGIYFCRLQAGDCAKTRKMVLLK